MVSSNLAKYPRLSGLGEENFAGFGNLGFGVLGLGKMGLGEMGNNL